MEKNSGYWQYRPFGELGSGPGCGMGLVQVVGKFSGGCIWLQLVNCDGSKASFHPDRKGGGIGGSNPGCLGGGKLGIALQLSGGKYIGLLYREMDVISGTYLCPKEILNGYPWVDERN